MPRLSTLARGYGSWNGDLELEKESPLKGIAKPILPQYLSNEDQPFYKAKTVNFPIRTKANHEVIKTIIAEAECIKSAKNRKHDDPLTIVEEIQSKVPMTQPSRERSARSQRWKSRPEFRTNHRPVKSHLRTRSAPATNNMFTIKPNGEMQLPKTFVTRKGAMVLFTAPSKIKFTKEGRCFSSNCKTKKDISNSSLSLGTIGKLCSSVLQYGEPTWTDDDVDSLASQHFHKTCMRFIRDEEGQECFDYRVQPGADFNFYLHDMQTRAVVRNLTRCSSAHSLTSTEAADELNEALDSMDDDHNHKHDDLDGKPGLITADANRLAESISRPSTSTTECSHRFKEAFSRSSTTQDSERNRRTAEMPLNLAAAERTTRLGSGRSMTSTRTSTPLSCAKLTASLKSANYLGRAIITPYPASCFEDDDSKIKENEMEDTCGDVEDEAGGSGDVMWSRQQSSKSSYSVRSLKADSRPRSRATDGGGDARQDVFVFEDDDVDEEMDIPSQQEDLEDNSDGYDDVTSGGVGRGSQVSSVGDHAEDEEHVPQMEDLMEHPDGRCSQLSRRSRRSSAQRTKTPDVTTSRKSSAQMENGNKHQGDEEQIVLSENEEIRKIDAAVDAEEISDEILQSATEEMEKLVEGDTGNSVGAVETVISRPLTAGSSHHSVRSFHHPASCSSNLESSVDFNTEQLQNIDGLVMDEIESLQHDGMDDGHNLDTCQIETDQQDATGLTELSSTPEEVALSNTKDRQSVKSTSIHSEESEPSVQSQRPLQPPLPSTTPLPPNDVSEKEALPLDDAGVRVKTPSVKEEIQSQQVEKIPEPKPPPRISSPKISPKKTIPAYSQQSVGMTPKPPAMKSSQPPPQASMVKKVVTPIHAGTPPKKSPVVAPVSKRASSAKKNVDLFSLKAMTNKSESKVDVKKKEVIGGPQFNDSLVKETYEEPGADEIEKMIQEELEKDLKEQGLIEVLGEGTGDPTGDRTSTGNMKPGKIETQMGLDHPKQEEKTEINLDTDDEAIAKVVKESSKGKKKSKKQILKEREELRELRRKEKRLKEEEAKALKARKKADEEETRRAEEEARMKKMEMEEEMQDAKMEAEEAREAEEQARFMLLESRKLAREEREAKRKAEMERKKEERNRQREERKKMEEAARKREQEMKDKLASVEDIRRQKELEREMEWEREEKERDEREEMERQEEEEKRRMEEEEERIRELEREAEEEALTRLVREREEAEHRMKLAAIETQKQKEEDERLRLEEQRKKEKEAERRRLQELEEERLREIERQRLLQIKRIEEEARARVLKKLEGKRIWAMRRRDANMECFAHLNSVRRTQGMTRPWVFSYYVHWPRQTYEKRLPSSKKKQRRPTRPPKPPADTPVEAAS